MESITIPSSVKFIGSNAFYSWSPSQTIYIQGHANKESADRAWGAAWRADCDARIVYGG